MAQGFVVLMVWAFFCQPLCVEFQLLGSVIYRCSLRREARLFGLESIEGFGDHFLALLRRGQPFVLDISCLVSF